ncbi:MAG: putative lipid II flippase FtsW [Peptococcaceae bacterium]|nr:putative lipid II flippase FtsW [Peptococcaceae bacterium]
MDMERRGPADLLLFFITLVLLAVGLIMVLSASSYDAMLTYGDALFYFKRQFLFMIFGFFAMFIMMNISPAFVKRMAIPFMIACIIMLALVPFIGIEVNGARRWLGTQSVRFAPAEIAKPVVIVFFAMWLTSLGKKNLQTFKGFFYTLVVLAIIPGLVVIEDLGTAISIAGALVCMMIAAEVPWKYLGGTVAAGAAGVVAMIAVKPYRINRILVWLDPFSDPLGNGYQAVQSLYALGSGGLFGVGLGASRQKLLHLPERHTDFIFSIIGEELGFIGAAFVILLFALFIWRGFYIAIHLDDKFKSLTAFGLTAVIGIQAMINIGVAVGFLPVTGITLPFISYGGTSLVFMLATVGFLLNMSRYMKH